MRWFPNDPWILIDQLRQEMNRNPNSRGGGEEGSTVVTSDWSPAVDIIEREDRYLLLADLAGVDPGAIEVDMENGILSIKGARNGEAVDDREFKRVERPRGNFYRRFSMPDSADETRITAKSRQGVLEITIPKHQKLQPRRIAIEE